MLIVTLVVRRRWGKKRQGVEQIFGNRGQTTLDWTVLRALAALATLPRPGEL